jgi:hypothetical protein
MSRWRIKLAIGSSLGLLVAGAATAFVLLRSDDAGEAPGAAPRPTQAAAPTPTAPTPTAPAAPTARIADCPVDQEICHFAVQAEGWVRTGDADSLIADGTPRDNPNDIARLKESITSALPVVSRGPRLASIGCPVLDEKADCAGAFSLTFTTLTARERWGPDNRRGVLTLGFLRRAGLDPQLTSIAGMDDYDRVRATVSGGRSTGCSLSGMPAPTETGCILAEFTIVTVERPAIAGQPPECPYLPDVCAFATTVERQLKAGEYAAVAGGVDAGVSLRDELLATLGERPPRLVSIGCPYGNFMVFCDGPFALAFTTLDPAADWTEGDGLILLRFERTGAANALVGSLAPSDPGTRRALINGGTAVRPCGLTGAAPDEQTSGGCSRAEFELYWSSEPFVAPGPVVVTLTRRAPVPPPANSVLFTAGGPCWGCDQSDEVMYRHATGATGKVTTVPVLENGVGILDGWLIGYLTAAPDGSVLAAVVCDALYCGPMGGEKPVATWRVVVSNDGGDTWSEAWRGRTAYATVSEIGRTGFVVSTATTGTGEPVQAFFLVRGAQVTEIRPPADTSRWPGVAALDDGTVMWLLTSESGLLIGGPRGEDGRRLPLALPPGAQYPRVGSLPGSGTWAVWSGAKAGIFGTGGELEAHYNLGDVYFAAIVDATTGFGTVALTEGDGGVPALIDFGARTVTPLGGPFEEPPLRTRSRPLAVQLGR